MQTRLVWLRRLRVALVLAFGIQVVVNVAGHLVRAYAQARILEVYTALPADTDPERVIRALDSQSLTVDQRTLLRSIVEGNSKSIGTFRSLLSEGDAASRDEHLRDAWRWLGAGILYVALLVFTRQEQRVLPSDSQL